MFHPRFLLGGTWLAFSILIRASAADLPAPSPALLDEQFELPAGFHIYRAASPELCGGSYDIAFDGQGRLLVGDGNAVRRLEDINSDGVYDRFEVIAAGLGWRGPQGLLVLGDRLYAVGGDGLQLFEGYRTGELIHRGRLGEKFNTGGDHDLHTVLRGRDGWLYLMAGNGAGTEGRRHITEASSPMLREREASVFRLDPEGRRWECIGAGGRNPPSLAMNRAGELFSFDSDMEWHVGLPWYKPVRLTHWAAGADQGWQDVGAYPPYFIDTVSEVVSAGRGSPNWGVFYEHRQLPAHYRDSFLVCDYRWKRASDDQYATSGRLAAFFLERSGAEWKARMETAARPRPAARDSEGRPISFALVDIEVAPDGSLLLSDHNQGLWRIFYDARSPRPAPPPLAPEPPPPSSTASELRRELLDLPQPLAEWSRVREEAIRSAYGAGLTEELKRTALDSRLPLDERLRAVELLAPEFSTIEGNWLGSLALDASEDMRAQAAWLLGLRGGERSLEVLLRLAEDPHPLARRRAAESLTRFNTPNVVPALIRLLRDEVRLTRFIAMNALARHPLETWATEVWAAQEPQAAMRGLVAGLFGRHSLPSVEVRRVLGRLMGQVNSASQAENRLDLMRVLALFEKEVSGDAALNANTERFLLDGFPASHSDVRWEQVRLLGLFQVPAGFGPLLELLRNERDEVTQFHIAQALARLPGGWTDSQEAQALDWFLGVQQGWFAEHGAKGVEFPQFWATVVSEFASRHPEAVRRAEQRIRATSVLGAALLDLLVAQDPSGRELMEYFRRQEAPEARARAVLAFRRVVRGEAAGFVREELARTAQPEVRAALWQALAAQPPEPANMSWLIDGIRGGEAEVARACAIALVKHAPEATPGLAEACLEQLGAASSAFHACERLLVTVSGRQRSDYQPQVNLERRPAEPVRRAALAFWAGWYREQFGRPFVSSSRAEARDRSDEEVYRFLLAEAWQGGNVGRGAFVYERLQCHTCHGGGAAPGREGRIFGPDLAGVTRRLTRTDLADALVYPSKQVPERFRAFELEKRDGTVLRGFVTEDSERVVTLADQQQLHRVSRDDIVRLMPQTISLMPERLLNGLTEQETKDLAAFLEAIGTPP